MDVAAITSTPPTTWDERELASLAAEYLDIKGTNYDAVTKYDPTPGEAPIGGSRAR
jgi:hypothetical protein